MPLPPLLHLEDVTLQETCGSAESAFTRETTSPRKLMCPERQRARQKDPGPLDVTEPTLQLAFLGGACNVG